MMRGAFSRSWSEIMNGDPALTSTSWSRERTLQEREAPAITHKHAGRIFLAILVRKYPQHHLLEVCDPSGGGWCPIQMTEPHAWLARSEDGPAPHTSKCLSRLRRSALLRIAD